MFSSVDSKTDRDGRLLTGAGNGSRTVCSGVHVRDSVVLRGTIRNKVENRIALNASGVSGTVYVICRVWALKWALEDASDSAESTLVRVAARLDAERHCWR